eukprot:TRINITY_DN2111_c0_g1_i1.p1 TRINITY_DN2111_c0_g1~~TRINITY_DN2111_c0_g1_i1.p1  ORF type:complete len:354 (-),score=53.40 TRINITY_DN2111_c0_g1_i1:724-1785(-)
MTASPETKKALFKLHSAHNGNEDEFCIKDKGPHHEIVVPTTSSRETKLIWETPPKNILMIKKPNKKKVTEHLKRIAIWLIKERRMSVYVEQKVIDELGDLQSLALHNTDNVDLGQVIDLAICLGGDGTLLCLNSLFPKAVPPIVAFNLGTLGFLTPFRVEDFREVIDNVLTKPSTIALRHRLKSWVCKENLRTSGTFSQETQVCLNEFVVDRGTCAYLTNLNLYCDNFFVTKIQGDGVIIATSTGSTAYSLSSGGSCLHPLVPALCLTPICPHSLSFRPIIFPDCVSLKIQVPDDAKNAAYFSCDGKSRIQIEPGDYIKIEMSKYPAPVINGENYTQEWFKSLAHCLAWNQRK